MKKFMSRRDFLSTVAFGSAPLLIPDLLQAESPDKTQEKVLEASASIRSDVKNVIMIFACGGMASIDSFDPKEQAPGVDTLFPIVESPDGTTLTEPFKALAPLMDHAVLIRNRVGGALNHTDALDGVMGREDEGILLSRIADKGRGMYAYMQMPGVNTMGGFRDPYYIQAEARWNTKRKKYDPLPPVYPDPRLVDKSMLKALLEIDSPFQISSPAIDRIEDHMNKAIDMVLDVTDGYTEQNVQERMALVKKARDIRYSDMDVRRYTKGEEPTAMSMAPLLARELVRRNVAKTVLIRAGQTQHKDRNGWDHHSDAKKRMQRMGPPFAHSVSELFRDWVDGKIPNTLLVVDTEFGRKPNMNEKAGREHALVHSSVLLGEGLMQGSVIGQTDADGQIREENRKWMRPVIPNDVFHEVIQIASSNSPDQALVQKMPDGIFKSVK